MSEKLTDDLDAEVAAHREAMRPARLTDDQLAGALAVARLPRRRCERHADDSTVCSDPADCCACIAGDSPCEYHAHLGCAPIDAFLQVSADLSDARAMIEEVREEAAHARTRWRSRMGLTVESDVSKLSERVAELETELFASREAYRELGLSYGGQERTMLRISAARNDEASQKRLAQESAERWKKLAATLERQRDGRRALHAKARRERDDARRIAERADHQPTDQQRQTIGYYLWPETPGSWPDIAVAAKRLRENRDDAVRMISNLAGNLAEARHERDDLKAKLSEVREDYEKRLDVANLLMFAAQAELARRAAALSALQDAAREAVKALDVADVAIGSADADDIFRAERGQARIAAASLRSLLEGE